MNKNVKKGNKIKNVKQKKNKVKYEQECKEEK